ncbi:amidohydrolase 2 [Tothia fuscella]|uniref:Amidohydrolase 2 n=1 Tax=Tothia fuscella TaxID=1048955 RepID=A0A9P4NV93_9PEZI|nr:amidohydrolase 2 [Tothia fuscella]
MPRIIDIHTHIYPPSYIKILQSRAPAKQIPYIATFPDAPNNHRLIILPDEDSESTPSTSRGRPVGPSYWDISQKIKFMDDHGITQSVISLANPWLDFVEPEKAAETARSVNDEIDEVCGWYEGRLFAFGTLPLSGSIRDIVGEVERLATLPHLRGVVFGTSGLGKGLDDPALEPVYQALEATNQLIFLHPHYGLPNSVYGPRGNEYGHVLPLALGFPLETTIAVTRMYLSGVFDRFPKLEVLLAHSGGTLPFLAGRIESCIAHDAHFFKEEEKRRGIWDVLKTNIYLDAVIYSEVGLKAAIDASGADRVMFGTDHPFFPPLGEGESEWLSVKTNYQAIDKAFGDDKSAAELVLSGNAARLLRLD